MHYFLVKLNCFILRTTTVAGLGVPIFRVFTVAAIVGYHSIIVDTNIFSKHYVHIQFHVVHFIAILVMEADCPLELPSFII